MPEMSMSPNVNSYGEVPAAEQAELMFKQRFSETAYAILRAKFPDLAPNVVTFKVLETDADTGRGVGSFILLQEGKPIYIPLIMTNSQPKPLEIFYYKELNIFLPLTKPWLEEVTKMTLDELGQGEDIPSGTARDVNIRNIVFPPQTESGRVGLAADLQDTAGYLFKEAQRQDVIIHPQFLNVLRQAPKVALDGIKLAFRKNPELLQKLASVYGHQPLVAAFTEGYRKAEQTSYLHEKLASAKEGELSIYTKTASSQDLREVFGTEAGAAFMGIVNEGYAVKDTRNIKHAAVSVKQESEVSLQSPGPSPGWFKLFFMDGPSGNYLVVPAPKKASGDVPGTVGGAYYDTGTDSHWRHKKDTSYLVIGVKCDEAWIADNVMGFPIMDEKVINKSKLWKLLNSRGKGGVPKTKAYGLYLYAGPQGIQVTPPFEVDQVITTEDGRTKVIEKWDSTYIVDTDPTRHTIDITLNGRFTLLPTKVKWIELGVVSAATNDYGAVRDEFDDIRRRSRKASLISDPRLMSRWMNNILQVSKARKVRVKRAGHELWWVEGDSTPRTFGPALQKVAREYDISVSSSLDILKEAQKNEQATAYILDSESSRLLKVALDKYAQPPMGQVGQEVPMGPGPQMPMEPEMQMPQQASPMTGTDLAIAEAVSTLREQSNMQMQQTQDMLMSQQQQMEQQAQSNDQLIGVLEGIQQRAQQINGATGGVIPAGAEQSPVAAAQMLAPIPQEEPPPPPQPTMDGDTANLSPETVAEQINPEMLDQAETFDDQGVFDTAAIAMLSAAPVLQDIVATYLPNLEKSLDNLGRILLTLWMKEDDTKEAIGDEAFIALEDKLRITFKNLGDVILVINKNAISVEDSLREVQQMTASQQ